MLFFLFAAALPKKPNLTRITITRTTTTTTIVKHWYAKISLTEKHAQLKNLFKYFVG